MYVHDGEPQDDGNDEGEEQEQEDDDQLAQILGSSNLPEAS